MYDGFLPTNEFTGWRDQILNKGSYLFSDFFFGMSLLSACRSLNVSDESGLQSVVT